MEPGVDPPLPAAPEVVVDVDPVEPQEAPTASTATSTATTPTVEDRRAVRTARYDGTGATGRCFHTDGATDGRPPAGPCRHR